MTRIAERAKSILESVGGTPPSMTAFQIERFVVGAEPTPWGRLKQACIEIAPRETAERNLLDKATRLRKKIKARKILTLGFGDTSQLESELESTERDLASVRFELGILVDLAEKERDQLPEEIRDNPWDDQEQQAQYYTMRFLRQAWAARVLPGVPASITEAVACLPRIHKDVFMREHLNAMVESTLMEIDVRNTVAAAIDRNGGSTVELPGSNLVCLIADRFPEDALRIEDEETKAGNVVMVIDRPDTASLEEDGDYEVKHLLNKRKITMAHEVIVVDHVDHSVDRSHLGDDVYVGYASRLCKPIRFVKPYTSMIEKLPEFPKSILESPD